MTAEFQPRHPLALLDLLIRVNAAAQHPGEEHEDLAEQFAQVMAGPATGEQLQALRAQAEAEAAVRSENSVLRAFVEAFANEDGCGCGYGRELLDAYGAAYDLMWPENALAQAGGES